MEASNQGRIHRVTSELIDRTLERARSSARRRANHDFHGSHADATHRFLNAWLRGSYAAPHRHLTPPKPESFVALRGELACFVFDDDGHVRERCVIGRNGLFGIDLPPGIWHTVTAVTDEAVCFEVKPGPWDPVTDKEFAPWAPREGEPGVADYLAGLLSGL